MPFEEEENIQFCTFDVASDLALRLREIGVSVGTIYEIQENGDKLDTTDDRYVNDGENYQYVAIIWGGPEQSLAITNNMFETHGYNLDTFTKLATASNKGANTSEAIMALNGNAKAVNANLKYQMSS